MCVCIVSSGPPQSLAAVALRSPKVRETGGAPRSPAPRNRFLVWTVKPSGCHCTDAFGGTSIVGCRPLLGALPLALQKGGGS